MPAKTDPELGINSWLQDELYEQYRHDRTAVDESWKQVFEDTGAKVGNGSRTPVETGPPRQAAAPSSAAPIETAPGEEWQPLRGTPARIAENMAASTAIPLATSQRTIAVKVMDENRRMINQHRTLLGKSKVS